MKTDPSRTDGDRFSYFMIRLRERLDAADQPTRERLSGVVERLGTGEKRTFATGDELVELVGAWRS